MENKDIFYWLFPVKIRTIKNEWNGRSSDELYELESREHFLYEVQVFEISPDEGKLLGESKELSQGFDSSEILFKEGKKLIGTVDINADEYRRLSYDYIVVCNDKKTKGFIMKSHLEDWSFIWERNSSNNPGVKTITGIVERKYGREDFDLCEEIMDAVFDLE